MSQDDLADKLNLKGNTISIYETKVANLKIHTLFQLSEMFGISADDLLKKDLERTLNNIEEGRNLLIPIKAQAGYLTEHFSDKYNDLKCLELPFFTTLNKKRTFQIQGDSMMPLFEDGDYVVCELVDSGKYVKDENVYVFISGDDGVILKSVINDKKRKIYQLVSSNSNYSPIIRHWEEIKEIWAVKYRITKSNLYIKAI